MLSKFIFTAQLTRVPANTGWPVWWPWNGCVGCTVHSLYQ